MISTLIRTLDAALDSKYHRGRERGTPSSWEATFRANVLTVKHILMGSYSTLYISGREVRSRKHELDLLVMTLFQKSERNIRRGTIEEVAPYLLDEDHENASEAIELLTY